MIRGADYYVLAVYAFFFHGISSRVVPGG